MKKPNPHRYVLVSWSGDILSYSIRDFIRIYRGLKMAPGRAFPPFVFSYCEDETKPMSTIYFPGLLEKGYLELQKDGSRPIVEDLASKLKLDNFVVEKVFGRDNFYGIEYEYLHPDVILDTEGAIVIRFDVILHDDYEY